MVGHPQITKQAVRRKRWRWRDVNGVLFILPWLITFLIFQAGPIVASFFLVLQIGIWRIQFDGWG